ncbi:MAG TPA: asparagine synthase-related protein, partial [Solirubrobacteraceae bacterium]|nr:asparagine synthase-related protein [Solirubrobacteraceae bacterium]
RLVAARDHFGVKPLYWWSDGRRVALASEVGALLKAGLAKPEVDRTALDHYLACRFVPAPRTLFRGINKLGAAELLVAETNSAPRVESWRAAPGTPIDADDDELAAQLAERYADAVERQMMSDVPYGAFLSGGVDSAAVVAAMKLRSNAPPTTFTIGFPGHGDVLDERRPAAETARIVGTDHRDTVMHETDFLTELARCVPRLEEPCGIPSAPALLQLSRFAAQDVKVVLAGQGADEPHGGYGRHQAAALLRPLKLVPAAAATPAAALARALPRAAAARRVAHLLGGRGDAERLLRLMEITDASTRTMLVGPGAEAEQERLAAAREILADVPDRGLLDHALYLDTHMFLPDGILLCNDKMSMAAGLELRVPFLDLELMRFVERIPASRRVRPRQPKRLHRRAVARLLPPQVVNRKKHGFSTPYDDWLRASLGREVERRYAPSSPLADLIQPAAAARLVDEHRRGRADHKSILFCLLELSEWHSAFVETREPVAA